MSFINREKLIKRLQQADGTNAEAAGWEKGFNAGIVFAISIVQRQPEAPIKRRAKAQRIRTKEKNRLGVEFTIKKCSICGGNLENVPPYNYCPYCGAKLEG